MSFPAVWREELRTVCLILALLFAGGGQRAVAQPTDFASAQQRVLERNLAGDFQGALQWAEQALAIATQQSGALSANAASARLSIAVQHQSLGQLQPAEENYRAGLAIQEKLVPADDISFAPFLSGLGGLLFGQGRYEAAEPFMRKSLALQEEWAKRSGDVSGLAVALFMLGSNYGHMSRLDQGQQLLMRSLATFAQFQPQGGIQTAIVLNNIATNRQLAGDYATAADYQRRALQQFERFSPTNVPGIAKIHNNLGFLYQHAGDRAKATEHYRTAIAQLQKIFPAGHPDIATTSVNYGSLLAELGRFDEAEGLLSAGLATRRSLLPPDHGEIALAHGSLGDLYIRRGDWQRATDELRAAAKILVARAERQDGARANDTARQNAVAFADLVKAEHRRRPVDIDKAFIAAQHAATSSAAGALAQMAARSTKDDRRLAELVRVRQDLVLEWRTIDTQLVAALANFTPQAAAADGLRRRLADADARITALDKDLAAKFPDFAELARPKPLAISEVQTELRDDEALLLLLGTGEIKGALPEETFIWVITKRDAHWLRSDLGTKAAARDVEALRCGLDAAAWHGSGGRQCAASLALPPNYRPRDGALPPFDAARAYALYNSLLGEATALIRGKSLLVVASGALTRLPFHVLVTKPPLNGSLASAHWLVRDHAITVLPAVSSVKALRRVGKPSTAERPMIGFGNPLLVGGADPDSQQQAALARSVTGCAEAKPLATAALRGPRRSIAAVPQPSGIADPVLLRAAAPLPETADELCTVARELGTDLADIHLGARASESEVKRLSATGDLARYRIVHFATHGALAGELQGTAEPGLILSPPDLATPENDGYLASSEIASLKLDADWVILSACNTAGGEGIGEAGEALSGLASAFFYAGARALLVSHWAVDSQVTVKLVAGAVGEAARDPKIGRAESLRRIMLHLIDNGAPHESHPSRWGPFVVVGEGDARK